MPIKTCVICGKHITYQFWVCANCENTYNIVHTPYREWPPWIKELVATYRREARADDREIPFSDIRNTDVFDFITRT